MKTKFVVVMLYFRYCISKYTVDMENHKDIYSIDLVILENLQNFHNIRFLCLEYFRTVFEHRTHSLQLLYFLQESSNVITAVIVREKLPKSSYLHIRTISI